MPSPAGPDPAAPITIDETIALYDRTAADYAERTARPSPAADLTRFLAGLAPASHILELGSGGGSDAAHMVARGFTVTAVDGSAGLAGEARRRHGLNVRVLKFDALDYEGLFDGLWANASLLHVPGAELAPIFNTAVRALKGGGRFYASFKAGERDWRDGQGRHFCAMDEERLRTLAAGAGLSIEAITSREGRGSDCAPTLWLALHALRI